MLLHLHVGPSSPSDGLVLLARSYMDLQEYSRASHVLGQKPVSTLTDVEFFVLHYARYLAGERRKEQLSLEMKIHSGSTPKPAMNPHLQDLLRDLADADASPTKNLDAFGLYLYAVVLKQAGFDRTAVKSLYVQLLHRSVALFPWNWSAWMELATANDGLSVDVKSCPWMPNLFQAHVLLLQCHIPQAIEILERLKLTFPTNSYLHSQLARAHYELRDFDAAHTLFRQLAAADPYRMEGMDLYSDVLYVKEDKTALSELAHLVQQIDKYRPETNCVIGNYYALKGQHERAIGYFNRAITLDSDCVAAWTLIGHEYIQMKNTNAAIEVYRRALDLAPNDYRAWYGLGQAYELLDLFHYSVYYYQKASAIRPYDARMWVALGGAFEKVGQVAQAKSCYLRAVTNKDAEGIAVIRLAKLYEQVEKDLDKAAEYYRMHWRDRAVVHGGNSTDAVAAMLFLANYSMQRGNIPEAMEWCNKLLERDGPEKEEAKSMLQAMRRMEFLAPSESP
ncbi:hypothetical protein, variant 1 [Aphanomyces invadans]|uniref:Cdc23 domain-containing protein n=1 Tax=Aphanomyces invadans TaxID=157072 RepID=A0A024T8Q7_9STRA|nr:hypothetical protein, variant 1 [Aphanomyces invadans]ETV90530.1 hypothetical protein, variant 1 [Aphanomyces invadans]|eukprot:XP_008880847.1 hypothetical protein, variant 1 [Aphanomyces invadans]